MPRYPDEFYDHLSLRYTHSGCKDVIFAFADGTKCLGQDLQLGLREDFLLHVANNHSMLGCIFAADGAPYNRAQRRFVYVLKHIVTFFLQCFSGSILSLFDVPPDAIGRSIFSVLVIAPVSQFFSQCFRSILGCTIVTDKKSAKYKEKYKLAVHGGKITASLLFSLAFLSLFFASLFSTEPYIDVMWKYTVQVIFVTFVVEILNALLNFITIFHFRIGLFEGRLPLINLGSYYCEKLVFNRHEPNKDYFVFNSRFLFGLLRIDTIVDRDRAVRLGWIEGDATKLEKSAKLFRKGSNRGYPNHQFSKESIRPSVFSAENPLSLQHSSVEANFSNEDALGR